MKLLVNTILVVLVAKSSASHGSLGGAVLSGPPGTITSQGVLQGGTLLTGPAGIVSSQGAIGPNGLPNGAVSNAIAATRGIAALSGRHGGAVIAAPIAAPAIGTAGLEAAALAGINTGAVLAAPFVTTAIGSNGLSTVGLIRGLGVAAGAHSATVLTAPSASTTIIGASAPSTVITAPSSTTTIVKAASPVIAAQAIVAPVISAPAIAAPAISAPVIEAARLEAARIRAGIVRGAALAEIGSGGIVKNGGSVIDLSGHGVAVRGPPTASVVIAGPSGKVAADGLWGPTATWASGRHGAHEWN